MLALSLGLLALVVHAVDAQGECFQDYQCVYRDAKSGVVYDTRPLCSQGSPFIHNEGNVTYNFQICGISKGRCDPVSYPVEHHSGVGMIFFGHPVPPNSTCHDNLGNEVPCTRDCETLGIGLPVMSLIDEAKPYEGVKMTHYGVPSLPGDPYEDSCEMNPTTGARRERVLEIYLKCNKKAVVKPIITWAGEPVRRSCVYHIVVESIYGCGCLPNCKERNCGSSGCLFSSCGNPEMGGRCPSGYQCIENAAYGRVGTCCKPDCRGRGCGSSCGVSCGTCPAGYQCNEFQQCVSPSIAPAALPSMLPAQTISTTTGGDKFAAFIGGSIATGLIGLGVSYFMRLRGRL